MGTSRPATRRDEGRAVHFTEEMTGFVCLGAPDYAAGYHNGKEGGTRLGFHLTISTHDLDAFLADPGHEAKAMGYVDAPAFGGEHLPVVEGWFNLFAPGHRPGRTVMRYRLWFFAGGTGEPLTLVGFKDVGDDPGLDAWRDTTCLFTRILEGHVRSDEDHDVPERARGLVLISPGMFARQLTTFRGHPVAVARFGWMFVRSLVTVYLRRPRPDRPS